MNIRKTTIVLVCLAGLSFTGILNADSQAQKPVDSGKSQTGASAQRRPSGTSGITGKGSTPGKSPVPAAGRGAAATPAVQPARSGPVKGTVLRQVSDWRGAMRVELCKYGGRILTGDIIALVKPNGEAYFMNINTRIYAPVDKKNWKKNMGLIAPSNSRSTIRSKSKEKMFGLQVNHYQTVVEGEIKYNPNMESVQARGMAKSSEPAREKKYSFMYHQHIWATTDFDVPEKLITECGRVAMMPDGIGLPIRILRTSDEKATYGGKGKWTTYMDTQKVEKNATLYASDFELPKGFRKVKSEIEVMMGEELTDF